jgi:anti-sigma-K factor RskA
MSELDNELLAGYVLGDLGPEEQQAVLALLREQPELAKEVAVLQETLGLLPYALSEPEPSPALKKRILTKAAQSSGPKGQLYTFPTWLAAVACVVALVLGVDSYRLRQELAANQTEMVKQEAIAQMLRTSGTRLVAFKPMANNTTASGSMVVTPGDKEAVLVLREVSPLAADKVYRLWVTENGQKVACGEFTPNAQGNVWIKVAVDDRRAKMPLSITLEPMNAPLQPTGPMVMTSES